MIDSIPAGADAYWTPDTTDTRDDPPDWLDWLDLPDSTLEALAYDADCEARCTEWRWQVAIGLAGGDAWVCERLALAGGM